MQSMRVPQSRDLRSARQAFLAEIGDWIDACIRDYGSLPPSNVHDQATYTTCWAPYIRATGDGRALEFMTSLRESIRDHFVSNDMWRHGYWRTQEAHHGTEHFELFLGTLWSLNPGDGETVRQLVDAAEHIGNWVPDVPEWFDWDTGLFRSTHFGTDGVRTDDGIEMNVPDHFRCVNISLIAHDMTAQQRYLDLADMHASLWARAIVDAGTPPVVLTPQGPCFELSGDLMLSYRAFVGQLAELNGEVDRAENLLASGAVDSLLRLWKLTGQTLFREAADVLMDVIVTQLSDPDAGAAVAIVRTYRNATGDTRYDSAIFQATRQLAPFDFQELAIEPHVKRDGRPSGIGKRRDMPDWFEDGSPRRRNPILLSVAAEISGDDALAARAIDIARVYFSLARQVYPHGRDHGCSATTVSAIARGHGRENGAGVVTAVLPIGVRPC